MILPAMVFITPSLGRSSEVPEIPVVLPEPPVIPMDTDEAVLFDLINAARRDPLGMAEFLGMNRVEVLKNLPDLADVLNNGLPELSFNGQLYKTATDHTLDMLANGYYAYESLDGKTVEQRLNEAGYAASEFGESLGLVFFTNFMAPDTAMLQIFAGMFKDELNPDIAGERNILNPELKELGVGVGEGVFSFDRYSFNAYMATCDFGAEADRVDLKLLQLVNQARSNPQAVAENLGLSIEDLRLAIPEFDTVLAPGLPPLAFSRALYHSADAHAQDLIVNDYFQKKSLDGRFPGQRMGQNGYYPALWRGEMLGRFITKEDDGLDPEQIIPVLFKRMFMASLQPETNIRNQTIFSELAKDAGIAFQSGHTDQPVALCGDFANLAVLDMGARETENLDASLIGTIYADKNQNALYDVGEEVFGCRVEITSDSRPDELIVVQTNVAGGFQSALAPGQYRVSVVIAEDQPKTAMVAVAAGEQAWISLDISVNNLPEK